VNDQQKEYLKRRRKQLAKRLQAVSEMKYTEALREIKKITGLCIHCDTFIRLDKVFGWHHGEMAGGWNTTCNDGDAATRAEPRAEDG
jgi:hypothetical protein